MPKVPKGQGLGRLACSQYFLMLAKISAKKPLEGEVFIQIRPVNPQRGNLNIVQLFRCSLGQSRVFRDGETNLNATLHLNQDMRS